MRNSAAWLIWALSAAILALLIRNPLYTTLIVLSTWVCYLSVSREMPAAGSWQALLKLGLAIWLVTVPFSALMNHGGTVVLFRLPSSWPLVGGPITLEAVLAGLASGYALWALLFVFATLNLAVDATQLMRVAPAFLYQAGIVTTIALTFVPQMVASAREIREAQRIRGHRFRGWRDTLPLAMPLLTTAFEHAIQLAEAMESRGIGGELAGLTPRDLREQRVSMVAALSLVLLGLVLRVTWGSPSNVLIVAGVGMLVGAFWRLGRHVRRTRYSTQPWGPNEVLLALCGAGALASGLVAAQLVPGWVSYAPLGGSLWPPFDLRLGLGIALLAVPGLVLVVEDARVANERPEQIADGRAQP